MVKTKKATKQKAAEIENNSEGQPPAKKRKLICKVADDKESDETNLTKYLQCPSCKAMIRAKRLHLHWNEKCAVRKRELAAKNMFPPSSAATALFPPAAAAAPTALFPPNAAPVFPPNAAPASMFPPNDAVFPPTNGVFPPDDGPVPLFFENKVSKTEVITGATLTFPEDLLEPPQPLFGGGKKKKKKKNKKKAGEGEESTETSDDASKSDSWTEVTEVTK